MLFWYTSIYKYMSVYKVCTIIYLYILWYTFNVRLVRLGGAEPEIPDVLHQSMIVFFIILSYLILISRRVVNDPILYRYCAEFGIFVWRGCLSFVWLQHQGQQFCWIISLPLYGTLIFLQWSSWSTSHYRFVWLFTPVSNWHVHSVLIHFCANRSRLLLDSTVCCQCGLAESRHYHCCRRRRCDSDFVATCVGICSGGLPGPPPPPPPLPWASAAVAQPRHCCRRHGRCRELPPESTGVRAGPATPPWRLPSGTDSDALSDALAQ